MIRRPPISPRTDTLFPYTTLFRSAGFVGRVQTLTLDGPVRLVPTGFADHGRAPDWRVHFDDQALPDGVGLEIGSGWTHKRATIGDSIKIHLDCPSVSRPVRANLLPSTHNFHEHALLWSPRMRHPKAASPAHDHHPATHNRKPPGGET